MNKETCGFVMARETKSRLETLISRAQEGKDLYAAKEFASYIQWSGIIRFLEAQESSSTIVFNAKEISLLHKKLLDVVHEQFQGAQRVVSLELSQIELINRRLELIAGQLSFMAGQGNQTSDTTHFYAA